MLIEPALPVVAAPEPIEIDPVLPELVVPELKTSTPLTPFSPALAVLIVIALLVLAMPWPVLTPTAPPGGIVGNLALELRFLAIWSRLKGLLSSQTKTNAECGRQPGP
jgi:hypothetical protein